MEYLKRHLDLLKKSIFEKNEFSLRDIRKERFGYIVTVIICMVWNNCFLWFSPRVNIFNDVVLFGVTAQTLYYITYCVCTLTACFLFSNRNFRTVTLGGTVLAAAGFLVNMSVKNDNILVISILIIGIGSGLMAIGMSFVYVFALNGTERIVGVAAMLFSSVVFSIIPMTTLKAVSNAMFAVLVLIILGTFFYFAYRYKEEDLTDTAASQSIKIPAGAYWMLVFVFAFFINSSIYTSIIQYRSTSFEESFLLSNSGNLIGIILFLAASLLFLRGICYLFYVNLFCCALGFLLMLLSFINVDFFTGAGFTLFGIAEAVGTASAWLLVAAAADKYRSRYFFRLSLFVAGIASIVGTVTAECLVGYNAHSSYILGLILPFFVTFFFLLFSPFIYPAISSLGIAGHPVLRHGEASEAQETGCEDEKQVLEGGDKLQLLTKREREVFEILVEGYTIKQIAAMLGIKYNTALTHYKNVYSKLEVYSRSELLILYGQSKAVKQ